MSGKRGLGKGLGALIPEVEVGAWERPQEIDVAAIRPNPVQPRREIRPEALEELSASIREHGVIQPLVLRRHEAGYQIIAGERRWRAAQQAGLETVPAVVREIDENRLLEIALVENVQREDLNALDEALALRELLELEASQEAVARKVGKSRPYVANAVRLLQLEGEVQELVRAGKLSAGHGRALLALTGQSQVSVAREVVRVGLTVRDTERLVKARLRAKPPRREIRPQILGAFESRLTDRLATRVRITGSERRGRIVIEYHDRDDLGRLVERLLDDEP